MKTLSNRIVAETGHKFLDLIWKDLKNLRDLKSIKIAEFHICSPFSTVLLNDGSIGSAGNYDVQNHTPNFNPDSLKRKYQKAIPEDSLLEKTLRNDFTLTSLSLRVAIISALSQSLLGNETLSRFELNCRDIHKPEDVLESILQSNDSVIIFGFGGLLEAIYQSKKFASLVVCDVLFDHAWFLDRARKKLKLMSINPRFVKLISPKSANRFVSCSHVCFITGSALCNGTMENLLTLASPCREVVIQGPSCSLFPLEFFKRSATSVLTTRKKKIELECSQQRDESIYQVVDRHYMVIYRNENQRDAKKGHHKQTG